MRVLYVSALFGNTASWKLMLPDGRSYVTVGGFFAMEIIAYICQFFL